ncbi:MAG: hypothetical protein HN952_02320 [Candidatus Cloacimonetes bacterium]|nr:hypothetical protein [Candidatus Cloacimonadota bacterium]MBT6993767.1 hypothetical protein [Candidatus Cloacimonadota bacterium]MBT7469933.1 hypothetical protein [Candidatus Cloacimonadota bacterium]
MHKFKALLLKDFWINKKTLLIPIWIMAGFYLLMIISGLFAYFNSSTEMNFMQFDGLESTSIIYYIANFSMITLPGLFFLLFTINIMQSALNEDRKQNCELFHRSMPVSEWHICGSKFLVGLVGNWAVLIGIGIFNFIVMNSIMAFYLNFDFLHAFVGFFHSILLFLKTGLVLGSIAFFLSAIFKEKAFARGIGILLLLWIVTKILNAIYGWNLPSIFDYLIEMTFNFQSLENLSDSTTIPKNVILNLKTLYQIIISGALFILSTLIYKNREIR